MLKGVAQEWAAPKVLQGGANSNREARGAGGPDLQEQVISWKAPKATDGDKGGPNQRGSRGDPALPSQAARWAGPAAQKHKGSSEGSIIRSDGKSREDILSYQAEQFFRPPSFPDQPIAGGSTSSTDSPNSNQPSVKRKLNPIFVEALMRWPTGLSGFERPAMGLTLWLHVQLGFLSALYSVPSAPKREQLTMFEAFA